MNSYKILNQKEFSQDEFSLIPIRLEDRYQIMKWRNEQLYHLRQQKQLSVEDQDKYFKNVVEKLFVVEKPEQLLFSFLENDKFLGYGGLVHINWPDKNAEISFVMDTKLEKFRFDELWTNYLNLIEKVAFEELKFHKIHTYAFDLRPQIYSILENSGYSKEAVLSEHCFINNQFKDVIIHSKFNQKF
ncbi:RimJ/RimL family protein N-acetyltransferase [Gramella sp. Hel_I_59]|uniref:GNAT family N-acetyltransferase n=1 Tax=Gramella sp. Hel_I_59 TaxID=1249978 RepID=UPI001152DE28|nr:GNAT family N-acetyltransferase [Gramella sp. Hel_I_59]TQI70412.1 RimJ/RimL family protein N-acetyltransferase [Gramella sp. Hel_I_59]